MSEPREIIPGQWLDSRDVVDRYNWLQRQLGELFFADPEEDEIGPEQIEDERQGIQVEIDSLQDLIDQCENISDWEYGVALIPDDDFVRYAEELAEDIGAIDRDASWPLTFIDWDAAANALKMDYTCIEWQGVSYWAR